MVVTCWQLTLMAGFLPLQVMNRRVNRSVASLLGGGFQGDQPLVGGVNRAVLSSKVGRHEVGPEQCGPRAVPPGTSAARHRSGLRPERPGTGAARGQCGPAPERPETRAARYQENWYRAASCCLEELMVGVTGFEPATSSARTTRATKLRHTPVEPRTAGHRETTLAGDQDCSLAPLGPRARNVSKVASGGVNRR